jgi:hypothetical protein
VSLITDPTVPNGCTTIATLDSQSIAEVPNSRNYYVGQLSAGNIWTPIEKGVKENSSDLLQAVDVLNGMLILWGSYNMEFWQDVGASPGTPFARINGASQTWGLAAKWSRAPLANSMAFLGQNPHGGVQVMLLNGYTPTRISDNDIENIIKGFTNYSDAIALTYILDGHEMYQLTFPSANRTLVYDATTGFWFEAQTGVGYTGRHFANLGIYFAGVNYVSDTSTGNIYTLSAGVYTDNLTPIKRLLRTRHVRIDGNDFTLAELILEMETGIGLVSGQGSDPQIMLRVSRDGGRTWGPERWKTIGKLGSYIRRVRWNRFAGAREYVFEFAMTDPVKFVITNGQAVIAPSLEAMGQ